jgi:hypothetical protein
MNFGGGCTGGYDWRVCPNCGAWYDAVHVAHVCNQIGVVVPFRHMTEEQKVRVFDTGATRDTDAGKLDYDGFLSPLVLRRFAQYMHKHRLQSDGTLRASDNWQKGIPREQYRKSAWRHFLDWWELDRAQALTPAGEAAREEAMCALLFNVMGSLRELLKTKKEPILEPDTAA